MALGGSHGRGSTDLVVVDQRILVDLSGYHGREFGLVDLVL